MQGPLNGGVSNGGGFSRSGLALPFLFFPAFLDLLGDGPGISRFVLFLFLGLLIKSTYKEQSRKGPRHNLDLSQKVSGKAPGFGNTPA